MALLMSVGGAYALASYDWCGRWPSPPPALLSVAMAEGTLLAGAAKVELTPPYPVVVAGYPPLRPEAERASMPLYARALVLEVEGLSVGVVVLDALHVPAPLVEEVRARTQPLGLSGVWVLATHTHSSFGGFDCHPVAQLAGTGRCRAEAKKALVHAAAEALHKAAGTRTAATLSVGEGAADELVIARSGDVADGRLTHLVLATTEGGALAQLVVFSAHPTLVGRRSEALSPDWPGALALAEENAGRGVTLVVQGAGGNASAANAEEGPAPYARKLGESLAAVGMVQATPVLLAYAKVGTALPRPDASRLVPSFSRRAGDNFLCTSAPQEAEVSALRLGPMSLLAVPGEPTFAAAKQLEQAAGARRVVGLANGYLGYVEEAAAVRAAQGEAKRQYFDPALTETLTRAAQLAGQAVRLR